MKILGALLFLLIVAVPPAVAQTAFERDTITAPIHAQNDDVQAQRAVARVALAAAKIKSLHDLDAYERMTATQANPLARLSAGGKQRFIDSLTFNDHGITGFGTEDLQSELTVEQIYEVLTLFGVQHNIGLFGDARVATEQDRAIMKEASRLLPPDYHNYRCASRATCRREFDNICTGNCFE